MSSETFPCHVCPNGSVPELSGFTAMRLVTSDCRPWKTQGRLGVCTSCGTVQKETGATWRSQVKAIYDSYKLYPQGNGIEQAVFDKDTGTGVDRSRRLLDQVTRHIAFPAEGRLLDIGAGNGSLLRVFGKINPDWSMIGTETNDKLRDEIEAIPGVEAFHTAAPETLPGIFDLISMLHVLEHIPQPVAFLRGLSKKLGLNGNILIQVPYFCSNPFDLAIADHCSHFTPASLSAVLNAAGYRVLHSGEDWVPKELTVIASPWEDALKSSGPDTFAKPAREAAHAISWLNDVTKIARIAAGQGPVGIFGTSIAATWLYGELNGMVDFFVDEDEARIGNTHLGIPILSPREAPVDVPVILALPTSIGTALAERLDRSGLTLLTPAVASQEAETRLNT